MSDNNNRLPDRQGRGTTSEIDKRLEDFQQELNRKFINSDKKMQRMEDKFEHMEDNKFDLLLTKLDAVGALRMGSNQGEAEELLEDGEQGEQAADFNIDDINLGACEFLSNPVKKMIITVTEYNGCTTTLPEEFLSDPLKKMITVTTEYDGCTTTLPLPVEAHALDRFLTDWADADFKGSIENNADLLRILTKIGVIYDGSFSDCDSEEEMDDNEENDKEEENVDRGDYRSNMIASFRNELYRFLGGANV